MALERTPSETLMASLEEVETAQDCMIIIIDKSGDIIYHSTTDALHRKIGMVEFVKQALIADAFTGE